jgi:hypothetical protein
MRFGTVYLAMKEICYTLNVLFENAELLTSEMNK